MGRRRPARGRGTVARRLHHHRPAAHRRRRRDRHQHDLGDRQARPRQDDRGRRHALPPPRQRRARTQRALRRVRAGQHPHLRSAGLEAAGLRAHRGGARSAVLASAAGVHRERRVARRLLALAAGRARAIGRARPASLPRFRGRLAGGTRIAALAGRCRRPFDPPRRGAHAQLPERGARRTRPAARQLVRARRPRRRKGRVWPARRIAPRLPRHAVRAGAGGERPHRTRRPRRLRRPATARL